MLRLIALFALTFTTINVHAQTQIKPYFMVVIDDSGSMAADTGSGRNSCGELRNRMNDAKCAFQRTVNAFGDVAFGLVTYKDYGNGSRIREGIGEDNQTALIDWVDFAAPNDIYADGATPIRYTLDDIRTYYRSATGPIRTDSARGCRPYYVILLTDGESCCDSDNSQTEAANAAARLLNTPVTGGANVRIPTHVIFFGTDGTLASQISQAGGTGDALTANNEEQLAIAFSRIISDSILTETCDGSDNDCDTRVDEGFQKYCDRDGRFGGATSSSIYCSNPGDDCDRSDDNCFSALTDEPVNACGVCGPLPTESCNGRDDNCNGLIDEGNVCMGCVPQGAENCNGRDDDCDGRTDESLTRGCGSDIGACAAGTETCRSGAWAGCTATTGSAEVCNNIDDDCNGAVDGISRSCGVDIGACRGGMQVCTTGAWGGCLGEVGPTAEICDGADNDCDSRVDEADPDLGDACGDDTGECQRGALVCTGGMLVCNGAVGPVDELCNGLDDDCDGLADDGLGVGAPCGNSVGECEPGVTVCRDGATICDGAIDAATEACNSLDDDCDGNVDEALALGGVCGSSEGICEPGNSQCISGREVCVGEIPAGTEQCDCDDNDCDGNVDEATNGALCPGQAACVSCQCALPCEPGEFGYLCPAGKAPELSAAGVCHCVAEACSPATCAGDTVTVDGETRCGPGATTPDCICKNNACTFACDGVVCSNGTVCHPDNGRCVEDSCRGLGCANGELCNVVTGECSADPCTATTCPDGQACRAGECLNTCATVTCESSELCRAGQCETNRCFNVSCGTQVCDPTSGTCVDNRCRGISCPFGSACDPITGECRQDACVGLRCPTGSTCRGGECYTMVADAGVDSGSRIDRVLGTGGGGCACDANGETNSINMLLTTLIVAFALRRRRRRMGVTKVLLAATPFAVLLGGCDVEPFCLNCEEARDAAVDAAIDSGNVRPDTSVPDAAVEDAAVDAGACPAETCNGQDDDCDGTSDEGFNTQSDPNHCGACGNACQIPGAFPTCTAGVCGISACDVNQYDLDNDPATGCEYRCTMTEAADSRCDLRDNDCDGRIDEDFDLMTDLANCGECGRQCRSPHATSTCGGGQCSIGSCDAGFLDLDHAAGNGCEYACTPSGAETCNRRDDDCDGTIDEGNPGGGANCGTGTGACEPGVNACVNGAIVCMNAVGPTSETCNSTDDDCDSRTDEGFLSTDVRNCGMCGNVCSYANGFAACVSSRCTLVACEDGRWNADNNLANGCEYSCSFRGAELCNDEDDDCDGRVDESLSAPANFCNPNGVCAGVSATCMGADGWQCTYPSSFQEAETRCDNLDNDCDGDVDEPFVAMGLGTSCGNGTGACRRNGMIVCGSDALSVRCNAAAAGTASSETCNGADDDCDGLTDEPRSAPGTNASYVVDPMVEVTQGGALFYMYQYEASRPDASSSSSGASEARACSRANVLPWTQISYPEAVDACAAAGARLCTEAEWQRACASGSGTCAWSYASTCSTYSATTCNGNDYDTTPGGADNDAVLPTGQLAMCYANHGGDHIYDMSGNVKEWTRARSAGVNPLRGGSTNNARGGTRCDFNFTVADDEFQLNNVGFRCCRDTAP